jgi:hypothetical protein
MIVKKILFDTVIYSKGTSDPDPHRISPHIRIQME